MSEVQSESEAHSPLASPGAFTDLLGQVRAIEALRTRVRTGTHHPSMILHGPPGVGRRTLARVYARGAFCVRPTAAGEPCRREDCHHCARFDRKPRGLGYLEYDPGGTPDSAHVDEFLKTRKGLLDDRSMIVLVDADEYGDRVLDRFLKTLQGTSISFILLARDERRLPKPIRSRCDSFRLRPLARDDAHAFLRARLPSAPPDERALDVLVGAGEGLPGRMAEQVARLPGESGITLDGVRRALALTWPEEMSAFWRALLDREIPADAVPRLPGADEPSEQVRRVRVILQHLRAPTTPGAARDPALLYREAALLDEPIARLRRCAGPRHGAFEEMWRRLAHVWTSGDLIDGDALVAAVQRSRRVVSGGVEG
ncbi:hypothetical protein [Methylobacterium segetis]|uniref:hypothetical protein n=1 Tax=Methylobacterium segetis TaxID=2488750 RepID=UPI001404A953|nr:hypothetical protein [Methylobacterium segetis]